MAEIRLAEASDLAIYFEHILRLEKESGPNLEAIFSPLEPSSELSFSEVEVKETERSRKSVLESGWGRLWILVDKERIYGHLHLIHRPDVKSALHRATLMMGVEFSHRSLGFGKQLMATAINWATAQPTLDWIDLCVFSNNAPAMRLYKKFGFKKTGTTVDLFRIHSQKISDVSMTLQLRK